MSRETKRSIGENSLSICSVVRDRLVDLEKTYPTLCKKDLGGKLSGLYAMMASGDSSDKDVVKEYAALVEDAYQITKKKWWRFIDPYVFYGRYSQLYRYLNDLLIGEGNSHYDNRCRAYDEKLKANIKKDQKIYPEVIKLDLEDYSNVTLELKYEDKISIIKCVLKEHASFWIRQVVFRGEDVQVLGVDGLIDILSVLKETNVETIHICHFDPSSWKDGDIKRLLFTLPSNITVLDLVNTDLYKLSADRLRNALSSLASTVKTIIFAGHRWPLQDLKTLLSSLGPHITKVNLANSGLSQFTTNEIVDVLSMLHPGVVFLKLSNYGLGKRGTNELIKIIEALPKRCIDVDFSSNELSKIPMDDLCSIFAKLPASVTTLNLSDNNLFYWGERDVVRFLAALPHNIKRINLMGYLGKEENIHKIQSFASYCHEERSRNIMILIRPDDNGKDDIVIELGNERKAGDCSKRALGYQGFCARLRNQIKGELRNQREIDLSDNDLYCFGSFDGSKKIAFGEAVTDYAYEPYRMLGELLEAMSPETRIVSLANNRLNWLGVRQHIVGNNKHEEAEQYVYKVRPRLLEALNMLRPGVVALDLSGNDLATLGQHGMQLIVDALAQSSKGLKVISLANNNLHMLGVRRSRTEPMPDYWIDSIFSHVCSVVERLSKMKAIDLSNNNLYVFGISHLDTLFRKLPGGLHLNLSGNHLDRLPGEQLIPLIKQHSERGVTFYFEDTFETYLHEARLKFMSFFVESPLQAVLGLSRIIFSYMDPDLVEGVTNVRFMSQNKSFFSMIPGITQEQVEAVEAKAEAKTEVMKNLHRSGYRVEEMENAERKGEEELEREKKESASAPPSVVSSLSLDATEVGEVKGAEEKKRPQTKSSFNEKQLEHYFGSQDPLVITHILDQFAIDNAGDGGTSHHTSAEAALNILTQFGMGSKLVDKVDGVCTVESLADFFQKERLSADYTLAVIATRGGQHAVAAMIDKVNKTISFIDSQMRDAEEVRGAFLLATTNSGHKLYGYKIGCPDPTSAVQQTDEENCGIFACMNLVGMVLGARWKSILDLKRDLSFLPARALDIVAHIYIDEEWKNVSLVSANTLRCYQVATALAYQNETKREQDFLQWARLSLAEQIQKLLSASDMSQENTTRRINHIYERLTRNRTEPLPDPIDFSHPDDQETLSSHLRRIDAVGAEGIETWIAPTGILARFIKKYPPKPFYLVPRQVMSTHDLAHRKAAGEAKEHKALMQLYGDDPLMQYSTLAATSAGATSAAAGGASESKSSRVTAEGYAAHGALGSAASVPAAQSADQAVSTDAADASVVPKS